MSGGRYDQLMGALAGRDLPAVGVSLGISRLFAGLMELGLIETGASPARVLVAYSGDETAAETYALASELRAAGIPTDVYPGEGKLGKQFKHANRLGVEFVCVLGTDELEAGEVTVKALSTGTQSRVARAGVLAELTG